MPFFFMVHGLKRLPQIHHPLKVTLQEDISWLAHSHVPLAPFPTFLTLRLLSKHWQ